MEMEFKDNSRRRTLVLVVGVLLALGAGAAAFMLSSQGTDEPETAYPTRDIVVAAADLQARVPIGLNDVTIRTVPVDDTNASAFTSRDEVEGKIAAIPIFAAQPITPNMLAQAVGVGSVDILEPNETVAPNSPVLRAVSLTVPTARAVGGLVADGQRVDIIATLPITVTVPIDPETGEATETDPETGDPFAYVAGSSTKLMWLDLKIIAHPEGSDTYIVRTDLQTAEEIAHAQNQGAQFSMALRPETDTRDVDRSNHGETSDTLLTRYNFRVPEAIDGTTYEQPIAFPSPFPAEPYLSPAPEPSPTPEGALIEIPVDENLTESPAPDETLAP
jgi:Flp pilus assembly protein CpaB